MMRLRLLNKKPIYRLTIPMKMNCYAALIWILLLILGLAQCQQQTKAPRQTEGTDTVKAPEMNRSKAHKTYNLSDFYRKDGDLDSLINRIAGQMSARQKIAQLVVGLAGELGYPNEQAEALIEDYGIGGLAMLQGSGKGIAAEVAGYQKLAAASGHLPLLISADAEPFLLNRNFSGLPLVPQTKRITHPAVSRGVAIQISELLDEMGIHWNYAPVCDFSQNQAIINQRSFGQDAFQVGEMASVFARESQKQGIIATAKHFPGHGMVTGDTHKHLVFLQDTMPEVPVFKQVIDSGVISVMVGHIAVRNHPEFSTDGKPATLSGRIVTDLLKDSLGFEGIAITDAMNMKAVSGFENASLQAFKAGCDVIITPESIPEFIRQVDEAVRQDPALANHLEQAVRKVIRLKICTSLIQPQFLNTI